jgi:hypothetical protein
MNKKKQKKNKRLKTSYPQFLSWLLAAAAAGPKKKVFFFFLLKRSLPPRPAGSTPDQPGQPPTIPDQLAPAAVSPGSEGPAFNVKFLFFFVLVLKLNFFFYNTQPKSVADPGALVSVCISSVSAQFPLASDGLAIVC